MTSQMTRGIQPRRALPHARPRSGSRILWVVLIAITVPMIFVIWLWMDRSNRLARNEAILQERRRESEALEQAKWNQAVARRDKRRQENLDSASTPGFTPKPECTECDGIGSSKIPMKDPNSRSFFLFACLKCNGKGFR